METNELIELGVAIAPVTGLGEDILAWTADGPKRVIGMVQVINGFYGPYKYLDNFWRADTEFEGIVYPTSEHAYQAAKLKSPSQRKKLAKMFKPGDAKKYAWDHPRPYRWEERKRSIMLEVLRSKFSEEMNPDLVGKLLETDGMYLEHSNMHRDSYWGTYGGKGENVLGLLLMIRRQELKDETAKMELEKGKKKRPRKA